jgi:hypothetical protein
MPGRIDRARVARHWVHSHEDDTDREMVFRPSTYAFPPSRGRRSLDLRPDGTLIEGGPGPTDRRQSSEGTWSLDGGSLVLQVKGQAARRLHIVSAEPDRLVVEKP